MTPSARLQAVLDLLHEIATTPRPADALTSAYFRARRYIGSKDRGAIATTLYDVLRHHMRLGWWLTKNKLEESPRGLLLTYLSTVDHKSPDEISTLFGGGKFAPTLLDEREQKLVHKLAGNNVEHADMPTAVKVECPYWAADSLKERFGKRFADEMRATLLPAPLDLRVNALKASRDDMLIQLKELGLHAEACALSPLGIRVAERPSLANLPMLKNGEVEIQDEGSQMAALLVDARPGHRVVDFCAGAGGKTLAIAAQMKNKGRIIACDVLAGRLKRSAERFRKAGVHNIEIRPLSSEQDPWIKRHKADFDRVLVDAPCSGTGTWRRNPDARWRSLGPGLEKLLPTQAAILTSAARLVKGGGRLIYATCSLLSEENEKQIEAFLAAHPDFHIITTADVLNEVLPKNFPHPVAQKESPYLTLTPAQHHTDGFFAAVLERDKKVEKTDE